MTTLYLKKLRTSRLCQLKLYRYDRTTHTTLNNMRTHALGSTGCCSAEHPLTAGDLLVAFSQLVAQACPQSVVDS